MKVEDEVSAIYRQYIVMVRNRATELLLGDKAAAEDVAQEVFIKFMNYRANHPIDGPPEALLYCITQRTCVDRMRAVYRMRAAYQSPELKQGEGVHAQGVVPAEDQIAFEQTLARVMKDMGEEEARIGAAFYLDELDTSSIAGFMRVSGRTVRRRLNKFRAQMRRLLVGGTA